MVVLLWPDWHADLFILPIFRPLLKRNLTSGRWACPGVVRVAAAKEGSSISRLAPTARRLLLDPLAHLVLLPRPATFPTSARSIGLHR
jgi:hypothetical protein